MFNPLLSPPEPAPRHESVGASFRTAEAWELVVFDRLSAVEREAFAELRRDPDFYGLLRPRQGGATIKAVDRDTALLLLTLREAGPLPFFVGDSADERASISQLVLDGVLEVNDTERDESFVSGIAALSSLERWRGHASGSHSKSVVVTTLEPSPRRDATLHPLARLSREALRFAAASGASDLASLTSELYGFHRLPLSPSWARRLPNAEAVLSYLGWGEGTAARKAAQREWEFGLKDEAPGWIFWQRRRGVAARGEGSYKLYVSPGIEELPQAADAVLEVARRGDVGRWKIGCDAAGLLRPDKWVLYFSSIDTLLDVARALEKALSGLSAHGVPFSAPIDAAGMLSWGSAIARTPPFLARARELAQFPRGAFGLGALGRPGEPRG